MSRGVELYTPPGAKCPMPIGTSVTIEELAQKHLDVVSRDMYDGDEEHLQGKTYIEANIIQMAREGIHNHKVRKDYLDRVMGKPTQRIDQTNVNVTLHGYLDQLVTEEKQYKTIDAEFVEQSPDEYPEEMFK